MTRNRIHQQVFPQAVVAALIMMLATGALAAQQGQAAAPRSGLSPEVQIQQRRFQFQLMERVLETAVRSGANEVVARAQGVMPTSILFIGQVKAKGFPLDGYGVVFNLEIPQIRESAIMLNQMTLGRPAPSPTVGNQTVASGTTGATTRATGVVADDPMLRSPIASDPFLADPDQFYRDVVKTKLINAMLDFSRSLEIRPDEWMSVVARGEEDPITTGMFSDSQTLILRIKGGDLAEFYNGTISREEVLTRIVESQF